MYGKKEKTERKNNRIKDIYLYIKEHGPLMRGELVDEFGMSEYTIERDLQVLKYNGLIEFIGRKWRVTKRKVKV